MLKSEINKLLNLKPEDVAKYFRNIYKTKKEFEENISEKNRKIIYNLTFNLLDEHNKSDCGYFFQKLLTENNITYSKLAKYIHGYIHYYDYKNAGIDKTDIQSSLQKILNSQNFDNENEIANYICKYFSIDLNVLKYGMGYEYTYTGNFDTKKDLIDKILEPCLNKTKETEKQYKNYKNFILGSDQAFKELLQNKNIKVSDETGFLKKEKYLWDFDYFQIMIMKLRVKELLAVFSLIEELEDKK